MDDEKQLGVLDLPAGELRHHGDPVLADGRGPAPIWDGFDA